MTIEHWTLDIEHFPPMPKIDIEVNCPVFDSFRVRQIGGMFDVPPAKRASQRFSVEVPDWVLEEGGGMGRQGDKEKITGDASSLSLSPGLPVSSPPAPRPTLATLVRKITDLPGDFRVRLSSIEAAEVSPELISLMAECRDRICPFLHLPMQSGSDAVLQRMDRPSTARQFIRRCREIQSSLDRPALCTDAIVGFPGETEADFAATCQVAEEVGFAKIHVFRFSPRPGTPAANMPGQVTNRIVQRRAGELGEIGRMLRRRYCRSLVGRKLQVMVETTVPQRPGWVLGTSEYHIPVALPGDRGLIGQFVWVTADSEEDGWIWALCGE